MGSTIKEVYTLSQQDKVLFVATNLKAVYDCLSANMSEKHSGYLVSYSQVTRRMKLSPFMTITVPYALPYRIQHFIVHKKFDLNTKNDIF